MKERITKEKLELIKNFLISHPKILAAYGYGSGVISQANSNLNDKKQIDIILVVEDLLNWIHENIYMNPQEFTKFSKKYFMNASISNLEKGAPIIYLSDIKFKDELFKIGIISKRQLLSSIFERTSSYVPFRLEKPCVKIFCNDDTIDKAILYDKQITLMLCLLMLDKNENKMYDLITKICSISYLGDFRTKIKCEDPNKIKNCVDKQLDFFIEDYSLVNKNYFKTDGVYVYINYNSIEKDLYLLPEAIKLILNKYDIKEQNLPYISKELTNYFIKEAKKEDLMQAIKGIYTTGPKKALVYGLRKLKKGMKYN